MVPDHVPARARPLNGDDIDTKRAIGPVSAASDGTSSADHGGALSGVDVDLGVVEGPPGGLVGQASLDFDEDDGEPVRRDEDEVGLSAADFDVPGNQAVSGTSEESGGNAFSGGAERLAAGRGEPEESLQPVDHLFFMSSWIRYRSAANSNSRLVMVFTSLYEPRRKSCSK